MTIQTRYQRGSWQALVDGEWTAAHDVGVEGPPSLLRAALPRVAGGERLTVLAVEWRDAAPEGTVGSESGLIFWVLADPSPSGYAGITSADIRQRLA